MSFENAALIAIDVQAGILRIPVEPVPASQVLEQSARLARAFRARHRPVVLTRVNWSSDFGDALMQPVDRPLPAPAGGLGRDWADLSADLNAAPTDLVITKRQWSAFHGTELDLQLRRRGVRTLVFTGIATNMGVESTARAAYELGYQVVFVDGAISSIGTPLHTFAMQTVFPMIGRVMTAEQVLGELATVGSSAPQKAAESATTAVAGGGRSFDGKVALVTGAGGGIGEAAALDLALGGAKVLVVDVNGDLAENVSHGIRERGGQAQAFAADVSKLKDCQAAVDAAVKAFGELHLAVNNAGISGVFLPLPDISEDEWRKVVGVNLDAVFFGMKAQLPVIERAGGGAIVNVASIYAHLGLNRLDAYTATKHAVLGLTRSSAIEYATRGIRINAVSPGPILTPLTRGQKERTDPIAKQTAVKRMGESVEVAKAVSFLLSQDASFVVGAELIVDGGVMLT